jgi:predicted dithiol-disulfide oxidoreductase (DUF899 family)
MKMPVTPHPNESPAYRKQRAELLEAEIALKDEIERVAALRRTLPLDTVVDDYEFEEIAAPLAAGDASPRRKLRLSELFDATDDTVVLMHFMFGKKQQSPCPMCTLWADGYDGIIGHLDQRVRFAVVVAGDVAAFRDYARSRGWRNLRVLSSADSSLKRDFGFEDAEGAQHPGASVFRLGADGRPRHFYSVSAMLTPSQFRGMDQLSPLWNFLDLTPEGRGQFMPKRSYEG